MSPESKMSGSTKKVTIKSISVNWMEGRIYTRGRPTNLMYLTIRGSRYEALADTGANVSVISNRLCRKLGLTKKPVDVIVRDPSGNIIDQSGQVEVTINYGRISSKISLIVT